MKEFGIDVVEAVGDFPVYVGNRDGSRVILKTVIEGSESAKSAAMLENELSIRKALGTHPNLCPPYKRFTVQADSLFPVAVMPLIHGAPLDVKVEDFYKSPDGDSALFKALGGGTEGLIYMHRDGIIHLDVKPSNIMVVPSGDGVLIDLGASKREGQDYPVELASHIGKDGFFGTVRFASPEQLCGEPVSKKSDAYSLGAAALDCIAQTPPYVMRKYGNINAPDFGSPVDLLEANPAFKKFAELRNMLERARLLDPAQRPGVEDMLEVLKSHEHHFRNHADSRLLPQYGRVSSNESTVIPKPF